LLVANLIRWGGLAAVLGAALFIIADLLTLVSVGQGTAGGVLFRTVVGLVAGVLLLLGVVGLYARQAEVLGVLGLVGFLAAFFGLALAQQNLVWASLLANLGWILFGAACLVAGVYPRAAVILLAVGALLSAVVNVLVGSGTFAGRPGFVVVAMVVDIIFQAAVGWLGISLFTSRGERARRPARGVS
jgi:hypothetical protein